MNPVAYIDQEELKKFFNSSEKTLTGLAYEWEGEDVVHIHTTPLPHSFGKTHSAIFFKGKGTEVGPDTFVVEVTREEQAFKANAFIVDNQGTQSSLEVNYIPSKDDLYSRNKGILEINILFYF